MKKEWIIIFNENGGEYSGSLRIVGKKLKKLSNKEIYVDGVLIEIDEDIIEEREIK